jgi:hypothetical protein
MIILAEEIIVFSTLDAIAIVWMFLKILVHHVSEPPMHPKKIRPVKKAA